MRGLSILMVSPYFYPEGGGLERYALQLATKLSENNYIEVLCMTRGGEVEDHVGGIPVHRVKPTLILSNTPVSIIFVLKVAKMVRGRDFVIAHTPVPFAADVAAFIAKIKGIPVEIVYHTVGLKKGDPVLDLIASLYSSTIERLTLRGAKITAVSRLVWEHLKEKGYHPRISFPSYGVRAGDRIKPHVLRRKVVLFVGQLGRYHRFKNLDVLLQAFAMLSPRFPGWELWVVGDGDMLENYVQLSSELGISGKTRFFGRINDPDRLKDLYSMASVLVLPSSFESFGLVVPEALSLGVPVVIAQNVGSKILVDNGKNGIILEDLSPKTLASSLEGLFENPKLLKKMGRIAWNSVRS